MENKCFAPTCSSGNMSCECKCSIFRAPKDEKRLILWRKAIPRADRILTQSDFICEKHFKECDIIKEWISDDGSLKKVTTMPHEESYHGVEETPGSQRLTNDDFRKLLMTPRSTPATAPAGSIREAMANASSMPPPSKEDRSEARRKKKSFYAALKKQEDSKLAELAEKYRDRARERRDGANPDYQANEPAGASNAYRAVAPDLKSGLDAAERRRQMIQESKFLGGDMEHTHLVKGLDYALLQKVRSEITHIEVEKEAEMELLAQQALENMAPEKPAVKEKPGAATKEKDPEEEMQFKTKLGRNIVRTIAAFKSRNVERNELFAPGRMAYVIDLDDEVTESDIPTTLIRSKADVPVSDGDTTTLSTNDIVINKLAQILSYLRQGARGKKGKKKDKGKGNEGDGGKANADDSIYGEIGDYQPSNRRHRSGDGRESYKTTHEGGYFGKATAENNTGRDDPASINIPEPPIPNPVLSRLAREPEGYAECYPGLQEMDDAIDDSDDEVDYTKMDLGNKKGPIGRWDFDTQEEYSVYMSTKEALPKAAFQYGLKTAEGRRTRKHTRDKNERAELDREWQKIQNIIQKRKTPKDNSGEPNFKMPKY